MRHRRKTVKLGMERKHRDSVLANLAKALILHEHVDTTYTRAKAGQRYAERLITLARRGDGHARRIAFSRIQDKRAIDKLFGEIGPRFGDRPGGYTRVVRLGPRRGDGAEVARLMLVE
ncbi:MAG: 50S ribosomal protein L17 [Candidatus Bipolaricaulota bacterium]|nr:MAG: 50S ribosomal protein L17 [Candidatus Bipolaricaulota bacterium]